MGLNFVERGPAGGRRYHCCRVWPVGGLGAPVLGEGGGPVPSSLSLLRQWWLDLLYSAADDCASRQIENRPRGGKVQHLFIYSVFQFYILLNLFLIFLSKFLVPQFHENFAGSKFIVFLKDR